MLDLSVNDPAKLAEAGFDMPVVLEDGTETDAVIRIRGNSSKTVRDYNKKRLVEMQMKDASYRKRGKTAPDMTIAEMEDFAAEAASVRIISWKNIGENGKEIPVTPENTKDVCLRYPFIRDQIMTAADDVTNFRLD